MSRLEPLSLAELPKDLQAIMLAGEDIMGFTPNDGLIMARKPEMLNSILSLVQALYKPGALPTEIKKLAALMTSSASGCQYCEAHTTYGALNHGVDPQKIEYIWEYQSHAIFTDAERIALDVARSAALVPNAVSDESFEQLKSHYNDEQIVELVGIISLFGFLNRWNSTLKTDIEATPKQAISALKGTVSSKQLN